MDVHNLINTVILTGADHRESDDLRSVGTLRVSFVSWRIGCLLVLQELLSLTTD